MGSQAVQVLEILRAKHGHIDAERFDGVCQAILFYLPNFTVEQTAKLVGEEYWDA